MTATKQTPAEVNAAIKAFTEFYNLYLIRGMKPGEVVAQHPEWKSLWYDTLMASTVGTFYQPSTAQPWRAESTVSRPGDDEARPIQYERR